MRYSLMPRWEKKMLIHEYRLRAFTVLLFTISAVIVAGMIFLLPTLIRSSNQIKSSEASITKSGRANADEAGLAENELAKTANIINSLFPQDYPSEIVRTIVLARNNIRIQSLNINKVSTSTRSITLSGVAPDRDSLLAFKTKLESVLPGSSVDLPISELAKKSNINFSISISQQIK